METDKEFDEVEGSKPEVNRPIDYFRVRRPEFLPTEDDRFSLQDPRYGLRILRRQDYDADNRESSGPNGAA